MSLDKFWSIGLVLVGIVLILEQVTLMVGRDFSVVGISVSPFWVLWLALVFASFLVTIRSTDRATVKALTLIVPISTLGPILHLTYGQLGGTTDFPGVYALPSTVPLWFLEGLLTVVPGIFLGLLWKRFVGHGGRTGTSDIENTGMQDRQSQER